MALMDTRAALLSIKSQLDGDLFLDDLHTTLYATDASIYEEKPLGVAIPASVNDIKTLISFASEHGIGLIPRGAGTSLAGQVVGPGLVVDTSKHFNKILELNPEEQYAWVEPGVNRDELNLSLSKYNLLFGPETSTSNRCTIGGMIGNNSCGSRSLVFGSTRDKLLAVKMLCSNGELVTIDDSNLNDEGHAGNLLRKCLELLSSQQLKSLVKERYPRASIRRRNHGYAIDYLYDSSYFDEKSEKSPKLCDILAGSEGTLGIIVAAKLALDKALPKHQGLLCVHCDSIEDSLKANVIAVALEPTASELMDEVILDCTKNQIEQRENRFFVKGNPKAILAVEFAENSEEELVYKVDQLKKQLSAESLGYHYAFVEGEDMNKVWELRKAGLGLLSNLPGDAKPIAFIEDTAVDVVDLPSYIAEFNNILNRRKLKAVHYAHAGSGELHLRPVLDLSKPHDLQQFKEIAEEVAELVKTYQGSLSGEHGDGRLRGGFIEKMYGKEIYQAFEDIKQLFDPKHIFNPNKIIKVPPIDSDLRAQRTAVNDLSPLIRNPNGESLYSAVNNCTGSGDCLKSSAFTGVMCPSYMATRKEVDSTRGRANVLRNMLRDKNAEVSDPAVKEALKLCLSCKACKRECPSNVDMARYKSEVLHRQQQQNFNLRAYLIARMHWINGLPFAASIMKVTSTLLRSVLRIHPQRKLPIPKPLRSLPEDAKLDVWVFVDEFTRMERPEIYLEAKKLLNAMGFQVKILPISYSGRSAISVGQLAFAKNLIDKNLEKIRQLEAKPVIGLEPSAILSFVDEYPDLCDMEFQSLAKEFATRCYSLEKFLGNHQNLIPELRKNKKIAIHSHCHQKAIEGKGMLKKALLAKGVEAVELESGCCGMAGFFGYDKDNYDISRKVAQNKLIPSIENLDKDYILVGSGVSCQQQLEDLKGLKIQHPATTLTMLMDLS